MKVGITGQTVTAVTPFAFVGEDGVDRHPVIAGFPIGSHA